MDHSIGDGIIVMALAAAFIAYFYFEHLDRRRRLEILHEERLAAMEKGIPLPELPIDPTKLKSPPDPHAFLIHGIVWTALGSGAVIALWLVSQRFEFAAAVWPFPLPLALLGIGLMLYYFLAAERTS